MPLELGQDNFQPQNTLILRPVLINTGANREVSALRLEECKNLALSIGLKILHSGCVQLRKARPSTLLGKGTIEELARIISLKNIDIAVVDNSLSPIQHRNLEKLWNCKILDRTGLIIEIFGARAVTKEGILQVELASLTYQRSRLVRSWTHLERQRGGAGFMGGPGELQIESDRRLIQERILKIKRELKKVRRTRSLHRKARKKVPYPVISLVGYTNAGKSTIFNALTGSKNISKNQLFSTLDPSMRKLRLPSGNDVILSDTVGFISDLPHELIEAFQATLEEVIEADLLVHIRDISHPDTDNQNDEVKRVFMQIGIFNYPEMPIIEVHNKIDCIKNSGNNYISKNHSLKPNQIISTSAKNGDGLNRLLESLDLALNNNDLILDLHIPWEDGKILAWLYENGHVLGRSDTNQSVELKIKLSAENLDRIHSWPRNGIKLKSSKQKIPLPSIKR